MNKKQIKVLEKYCPEIITQINLTKLVQHGKDNPAKWPIHTEQGFKEIKEDKIRLNSNLCL